MAGGDDANASRRDPASSHGLSQAQRWRDWPPGKDPEAVAR